MSKTTQCQRVIDYMAQHGGITQMQAMNELGVMRLASRISDIRKSGVSIIAETHSVKNRYGETCRIKCYRLEE